jgi:hypothetical protein
MVIEVRHYLLMAQDAYRNAAARLTVETHEIPVDFTFRS